MMSCRHRCSFMFGDVAWVSQAKYCDCHYLLFGVPVNHTSMATECKLQLNVSLRWLRRHACAISSAGPPAPMAPRSPPNSAGRSVSLPANRDKASIKGQSRTHSPNVHLVLRPACSLLSSTLLALPILLVLRQPLVNMFQRCVAQWFVFHPTRPP